MGLYAFIFGCIAVGILLWVISSIFLEYIPDSTNDLISTAGSLLFSCITADLGGDNPIDCDGTDVKLYPGWYRIGFCGDDVTDEIWGGGKEVNALMGLTWDLLPVASQMIGEAAQNCTNAVVPSFTGALEDADTEIIFWVLAPD